MLHKIKPTFPSTYYFIIKTFLENQEIERTTLNHPILSEAKIPQGSSLSPIFYIIYAIDNANSNHYTHYICR